MNKPPLGVPPKRVHDLDRAIELTEAIHRYLIYTPTNWDVIFPWVDELHDIVTFIEEPSEG